MKFRIRFFITIIIFSLLHHFCAAQIPKEFQFIDTALFGDDTHHWYDISEKDKLIQPKEDQRRYKATQLTEVADNIVLYQKNNGGWPKNYDMLAILSPEQKDTLLKAKNDTNTTFDNRTTYSHIAALSKIYYVTKNEKYRNAALKGLDFILASQFANGGWPQYFPLQKNYSRYITYNDDAYYGIMKLLKDILDGKPQYDFIDAKTKQKLQQAFENGLNCILNTQINDDGELTAWCQQYDEVTLSPAWARKFEPPSICNGESTEIALFLMSIENPSKKIIDAVQSAVHWFNESKIMETKVQTIAAPETVYPFRVSKTDKVVVHDPSAPPIWTRYYELKTHRPLFCNRDSKVVYSLAEVDRERRDGYGWYTYEPQKVLNNYFAWQKKWDPSKNVLNR